MRRLFLPLLLATTSLAAPIDVHNNHPFPVRMPFTLHDSADHATTIFVDVPANSHQSVDPATAPDAKLLSINPTDKSVSLTYASQDRGTLTWSLVLHPVSAADAKNDALSSGRPAAFSPQPLKLSFKQSVQTNLFTTYTATTTSSGLDIRVDLDAYPAGFLDMRTTVTNRSAPTRNVYAAILTHWTQPKASNRVVDYNSTIAGMTEMTPWRKPGERHQFVGRGVNWILSYYENGSALWLNAFAPSFTVHHDARGKTPAQWVGANSPQLDQEAYVEGDTLTHVTELAHGSVKSYRSRLDDYVLPDPSQPLTFTHRLQFTNNPLSDNESTDAFVAYTTFNLRDKSTLDLGARHVKFGTAYFPYSTLGENFVTQKLPGMSQDSYWPFAADVVKNDKLFADDIRRDLRLAKAMGFESIRLHHLEMLWTNPADAVERSSGGSALSSDPALQISPEQRTAFLDFFFAELKHCGLTALADVKIKPADLADLVTRYRPQLDGVEIDNEVLIFGIRDADVPYWKECYAAVKRAASDLPVHWTAHTNTAAFKRLDALGVPYDRVGQHAYADGESAIPLTRDFALQVASFASTVNKPPVITEWNWRFLTKMTEEARAKIYAPIFENVFKAGAMPEIYQFQFNDSLAMSPLTLKGMRHYELLNLSRRPKAEALEFEKLVRAYADPASAFRTLETHYQHVTIEPNFPAGKLPDVLVSVQNTSDRALDLTAAAEGPDDLHPTLTTPATFTLPPHATHTAQLHVTFPKDALPGFYHAFVRFESKDDLIAYAPVEFRLPGQPTFDSSPHPGVTASDDAFTLDLTKPTAIVYGDDCPPLELEAAWTVYQTLESACGRRVFIFTASELPKAGITNTIYVGTPKSLKLPNLPENKSITRIPGSNSLAITGSTPQEACLAAMDYALRYWKTAKDAACRRVPLVEREIPKGGDAGQLP